MSWMAWTLPTAIFWIAIVVMLIAMTVWESVRPTVPRRGLLPMETTRGDRLFVGLLLLALVNLAWLALVDASQWPALAAGLALLAATLRWG